MNFTLLPLGRGRACSKLPSGISHGNNNKKMTLAEGLLPNKHLCCLLYLPMTTLKEGHIIIPSLSLEKTARHLEGNCLHLVILLINGKTRIPTQIYLPPNLSFNQMLDWLITPPYTGPVASLYAFLTLFQCSELYREPRKITEKNMASVLKEQFKI